VEARDHTSAFDIVETFLHSLLINWEYFIKSYYVISLFDILLLVCVCAIYVA
jgi:hypothetical protein